VTRICFALCLLIFCTSAHSFNKYVQLVYSGDRTQVTVDYSGLRLSPKIDVDTVLVYKCVHQPTGQRNDCGSNDVYLQPLPNISGFTLDESGLYKVVIKDGSCIGADCFDLVVWEQFVALHDVAGEELKSAISAHAPVYSFDQDEEYYPVSIETLFDRPISNYSFGAANRSLYQDSLDGNVVTAEFMASNGHLDNVLNLDKNIARLTKGSPDNFPIYWYVEKVNDNRYWVTYFSLFAFDKKYPEYLRNLSAEAGSHEIDRESISVLFVDDDNGWSPESVVYAGHLEDQNTQFRGCDEFITDCLPGSTLVEWGKGKTIVNYPNYARFGEKPIVYIAHGSHAHSPAFGYYEIDVNASVLSSSTISEILDVVESAGDPSVIIETSNIVELDFRKISHQSLTFSGYLIPSPISVIKGGKVHPFVRYPTSIWAESAGSEFNDCVAAKQGCEKYIERTDIDTDSDGVFDQDDAFPFDSQFSM